MKFAMILIAAALLGAATPVNAQADPEECSGPLRVTSYSFVTAGVEHNDLDAETIAGSNVTANVHLEGCGETELSFVSYQAQADFALSTQVVHDAETHVVAQGEHNLTISVPICLFQVDLVFGAVIEHFTPPNGTYHGQDRVIVAVMGGLDCSALPAPPVNVCPVDVTARAEADGTVVLVWAGANLTAQATGLLGADVTAAANATLDANNTIRIYRAAGAADMRLLGEVTGDVHTHVDATAEAGVTYRYALVSVSAAGEARACAEVEVTTIPYFPTPVGALAALAVAALAYVGLRRRR